MEPLKFDPTRASRTQSDESSLNSKDRKALILRCQLALFSAYRADQYADPEGFKYSLGAILEGFADEVIRYVCDPRTGLQRRHKWPPTMAEIVEACEDHRDFLKRLRTERPRAPVAVLPPPPRPPGYCANVFVPEGHVRYQGLVDWAKDADPKLWMFGRSSDNRAGIWIARGIWEIPPAPKQQKESAHG